VNEKRGTWLAIALAVSAAVARLVPLGWLHPLNWDEIEFYRATRWIAEGRVPFRDFWEHHSPLAWFVFAPFSLLTDSPGAAAIFVMRWSQVPVWIATFYLANVLMRNAGLSRFARWAAMALALSSSFLMISAVEYRIDPLACLLYLGGLVLVQRDTARSMFGAGVLFCLVGLANIRFGPLLVVTVLLLRVVDLRARKWRGNPRGNWIFAGGIAALALALLYFFATGSFDDLVQHVVRENAIGDKYQPEVVFQFWHRLLMAFGIRVMGVTTEDGVFALAAVDIGGILLLLLGFAGLTIALFRRFREPDDLFAVALLQVVNIVVIARMDYIYNYHFQLAVLLMLPLIARVIELIPRRALVIVLLVCAWSVNLFASLFRGKELDLAYQDFVMREIHARTKPDETVFAGQGWALRREPAYRFWFMPTMTRVLVQRGDAEPYRLENVVRNPPAIVVFDHLAKVWLTTVQRELAPYFIRHYAPVWRNLWIPAMNVRLRPELPRYEWIVPRDGEYRLFASEALARHVWFRDPIYVGSYEAHDVTGTELDLGAPAGHRDLTWWIDGQPVQIDGRVMLRKGQRVSVAYSGQQPIGVILLSGNDTKIFRQPPTGATLEASTARYTHMPRFGYRIQP
jgi:hypothetical protein